MPWTFQKTGITMHVCCHPKNFTRNPSILKIQLGPSSSERATPIELISLGAIASILLGAFSPIASQNLATVKTNVGCYQTCDAVTPCANIRDAAPTLWSSTMYYACDLVDQLRITRHQTSGEYCKKTLLTAYY